MKSRNMEGGEGVALLEKGQRFSEPRDYGDRQVVHGLALCRYDGSTEIYRFSCDADWDCQQDSVYDSIAEAKPNLPAQYRRVEPEWQRSV